MRDKKADKVGFEPTIRLPVYSISNAAPSTARTPVQWKEHYSEEVRNAVSGAILPQAVGVWLALSRGNANRPISSAASDVKLF